MINLTPYYHGDERAVKKVLHSISALTNKPEIMDFISLMEKIRDYTREENDIQYHKNEFRVNQGRIQAFNMLLYLFDSCNEILEEMSTREEDVKRHERS